jgi:hypothetical protein
MDGAIPMSAMVEREMEVITAEAAHLRVAANDHIEGSTEPGHPSAQFRPGEGHRDREDQGRFELQCYRTSGNVNGAAGKPAAAAAAPAG